MRALVESTERKARTNRTDAIINHADELVGLFLAAERRGHTLESLRRMLETAAVNSRPIGDVIGEVVIAKRSADRREVYTKHLKMFLSLFARGKETVPISDFTAAEIEAWISSRNYRPETRATALSRIGTLFAFAVRRGYIAENPIAKIDRVSVQRGTPKVLTIEQVHSILDFTQRKRKRFLAWLVLSLFAGLRPNESSRIRWRDIDLKARCVRVESAASKIRQRRIVNLMPAAVRWLKVSPRKSSLPVSDSSRRRFLRDLRTVLGLEAWPADILRHTAASMLLAHHQDAGFVAGQLGNSVGVLLTRYRALVDALTARKFWGVTPTKINLRAKSGTNQSRL